ncbi:hypothetical protein PHMEG_00036184 [Phytophthora megakarya]|uniref:Uncharacterized protein n=1 Tax=Phytophthora megakarya TaxID=4795 RepID=A0A225UM36_9STRA|nr:hypothetical protein PHMEG_00036184 [Phytophthora megakarya]
MHSKSVEAFWKFHISLDATFKMNTRDFPVHVFGISDRCRSFHLIDEGALRAVKILYGLIAGRELRLRNVMQNVEAGQYNAMDSVFGADLGM